MSKEGSEWNCTACTFLNDTSFNQCQMCQTKRVISSVTPNGNIPQDHETSVAQFLMSIDPKCHHLYFKTFIDAGYDRIKNILTIDRDDLTELKVLQGWRKRILK